jgi:short-subunit dehydrogenase
LRELRGRNALVTGAAGGLGGYIARALAAEGVNLALSDLPEADLGPLRDELAGGGAQIETLAADLTRGSGRGSLIAAAEAAVGPLDILVNNAGLEFAGDFLRTTDEELEAIVDVNLLAVMALTRDVLPGMLERGRGHIVNLASLAGKITPPYLATYVATKHGVVGFTHSLRAEHVRSPIGFSVICPGFISDVGMYGRMEDQVGKPPWALAALPPSRVGEAVVRAIRDDRPEVIVNRRPARSLVMVNAVAPGRAVKLLTGGPLRKVTERYARATGRHRAAR